MSRSALPGTIMIVILCLIPIFLLFQFGPKSDITSYTEFTHKLGQITALVGITLFALTFVLSTRLRIIEDAFGGLDKVYTVHGIIGSITLVLLVFHPILLVLKFMPSNFNLAAKYLLPGSHWSVNFGIIALVGMIVLIGITLYSKIKYQKWKLSHEFLGVLFIIAILHIFLVRDETARDYIFEGYYIFAGIVAAVGLVAFIYALLLRKRIAEHRTYRIKDVKKYGNVFRITFSPEKDALTYKSGQFVFLRFFSKKVSSEPHPFSIASKSNDTELRVYIKKLGDFTSELDNLRIGDKAIIEGPYGKFNFTNTKSSLDQIWIAGGIGITPFIGMAQDLGKDITKKITLYYAVNFQDELLELELLKTIEKRNNNFQVIPWIKDKNGYLDAKAIREHSGSLKNKEFYICGPPGMKSTLEKALIDSGVQKNKIIMEDFSFR